MSSPQLFELWGDGPIFPGPGWSLRWPLAEGEQRWLHRWLGNRTFWAELSSQLPERCGLPDQGQITDQLASQPDREALAAIVIVARCLLAPAELAVCARHTPIALQHPCLVLCSDQHELAGSALRLAALLIRGVLSNHLGAPVDLVPIRNSLAGLRHKVSICCEHPLTAAQLLEARRRGIPTFLIDADQRLYQLGSGSRSRWISSTSNDRDSAFGVAIAADKARSLGLLKQLGLPVPRELQVPHDVSEEGLLNAVHHIGYPCVLKPRDGEQGVGVTANIGDRDALLAALRKARGCTSRALLLQAHVPGDDYRLNVVDGRLSFVVKRSPPEIIGDGVRSIAMLIEDANKERLRLRSEGNIAGDIDPTDPEVLGSIRNCGFDTGSILPAGQRIRLRANANISTGGLRQELDPAAVHPVIRRQSIAIARTFRLEMCGIDYISPDISRVGGDCQGAFIEVNSMPQNAVKRASALLDHLFPDGRPHSIPEAVLVGDWEPPQAARLNDALAELMNAHPNSSIGVPSELASLIVPLLDRRHRAPVVVYRHPRELMLNHAVDAVIHLLSPLLLLRRGLPADRGAVVVIGASAAQWQASPAWTRLLQRRGDSYAFPGVE